MSRRSGKILLLAALATGVGACAQYHAEPITPARVDKVLQAPSEETLRVRASRLHHPLIPAVTFDPRQGLSPDEAAVMAILINPSLRAVRDQRQAAAAQLLQAGILPNPQFSYNADFVTGGDTTGTFNAYGLGLSWNVTSLLTHDAKIDAARAESASVEMDIAWQEWQVAEAAKTAVYDLVAVQRQLELARQIDAKLGENVRLLREAVDKHEKSIVDFAAADASARDAHATVLGLEQQEGHERLALLRALGLPPATDIQLRPDIQLPAALTLPNEKQMYDDLSSRRLDLVALRLGYESQEETLRAAVLAQFPNVSIGYNQASDTTNVHTSGVGVVVDLPVFDRNQGGIATEKATRQRLFDEYTNRVFTARADVATALADIHALTAQIADLQEAIPSLQRLVDTYKDAYDHGNADVISYYTAITNLQQRSLDLIKLQQQLVDNEGALELAAGWYLPEAQASATQPAVTIPSAKENKQ